MNTKIIATLATLSPSWEGKPHRDMCCGARLVARDTSKSFGGEHVFYLASFDPATEKALMIHTYTWRREGETDVPITELGAFNIREKLARFDDVVVDESWDATTSWYDVMEMHNLNFSITVVDDE